MNKLINIESNETEILTIDSREVSNMLDMRHNKLLRKIDNINKDFTETKIGFSKYWIETTYKDSSGKENRCYEITKTGCEFLAHKTTGTKGNLFTHYYMEKFEELEKLIYGESKNSLKDISNITIDKIDNALDNLKSEYSSYIRPLAKDKYHISKYIKSRLGIQKADKDYETVKIRTLGILRASKWGDIPYDKLDRVYSLIDDGVNALTKTETIKQGSWI